MVNEVVLKRLHKWYISQHIKSLINKVDELYQEKDFFASYGLSLIIKRLLTNMREESE